MKIIALMVAAAALSAAARSAPLSDSERHRAVDALFAPYQKPGTPGMAVGIRSQSKVDFLRGYGWADLEQGTRITPQTQFHVASVSKQFAAFAMALLEREGKVDLNADIRRWLPEVPDFGRPISAKHLIYHTSGLRDQWAMFQLGGLDYRGVLLQEQVMNMVSRQRGLNFATGAEYAYSNTGYTLLAEIVRAASGQTFRQFTNDRIFQPLGMTRSFFYDDFTELVPGRAHSYSLGGDKQTWHRELLNMQTYGATSLFTTAEDLLKWAGNFSRPVVGDAALNRKITSLGTLDDGSPINYAFGLRREPFAGHEAVAHTGHDAAFNTVFAWFPERDFTVVILANQSARLFPLLEEIVRLYLGTGPLLPPGNPPAEVPAPRNVIEQLKGQYVADHGALVSLDLGANGDLVWNSISTSDDRPGLTLIFRADGSFDLGGRTRGFSYYRLRKNAVGRIEGFDLVSNVGGGKLTPYRRVGQAKPSAADLADIAGDYYSPEFDATYTFAVEKGSLTARSLWTDAPIVFTPSVTDRFDSGEGLLPTVIVERDASKRPQRVRIQGEYMRNVLLERQPPRDTLPEAKARAGNYLKAHYTLHEFRIPMRDGVKLFTRVFAPKDQSVRHPILMERTPYGLKPYGTGEFPSPSGGPLFHYAKENFIFVSQDVRGRYASEGEFVHLRPHKANKSGARDTDESTDTYDTLDWLVKHLPNNNGRACMIGLSYSGFYAAMGAIDAHPALKCVSPQAPATDWFRGDDFRHNGAFFLTHAYHFFGGFDDPGPAFKRSITDGYAFFLKSGPPAQLLSSPFWKELTAHESYDAFWRERSVAPQMKRLKPAVLTVGGWYDAENLYGALNLYQAIEHGSSDNSSMLVMGPWAHSEWSWTEGRTLGPLDFLAPTADQFREQIELPFLRRHLQGDRSVPLPEAFVFETGRAQWRTFDAWPPRHAQPKTLFLGAGGRLSFEPVSVEGFDEYVSDPAKPVPFRASVTPRMPTEYMVDDQRFAASRPDVLVYQTDVLDEDVTLAGPVEAALRVSTSGTDSDWIVKLIDVYPPDHALAGYQQLVRGEPLRGKFREGFDRPAPFVPNEPVNVRCTLPDVFHTFLRGHRIMVQVQSSWFPLIDRNPQVFMSVQNARPEDYIKATQRVYYAPQEGSALRVNVLKDRP